MSSRSLIVLGVVATVLVLVFSSLSVGFGSNNYLFQDGSIKANPGRPRATLQPRRSRQSQSKDESP